jgi:predicted type IV restriction endonuclease
MKHFIGVDPAFRENGFYVCELVGNEVMFIKIKQFIDFIKYIDNLSDTKIESYICIENSNETNHTFISPKVKSLAAREKISRDVGKNQAVSQMSVDYANYRLMFGIYSVSPAEKGIKWDHLTTLAVAKSNGHELIRYKGLAVEQDKRDAYKLATIAKSKYLREFRD